VVYQQPRSITALSY